MNKKTTAAIVLCSAMAAVAIWAGLPTGLSEKWGGSFTEQWRNEDYGVTGLHWRNNNALSSNVTIDSTTAYFLWDPAHDFGPNDEVARSETWTWNGNNYTGKGWVKSANGRTVTLTFSPGTSPPLPPKYLVGTYENRDEHGSYWITGQLWYEVKNETSKTYDITLQTDWWWTSRANHSTVAQFYVKQGELNGCFPVPFNCAYAVVEDHTPTAKARP